MDPFSMIAAALITAIGSYAASRKAAKAQEKIAKKAFDPGVAGMLDMGSGKDRAPFAEQNPAAMTQNSASTASGFGAALSMLPQNVVQPSPIVNALAPSAQQQPSLYGGQQNARLEELLRLLQRSGVV